MSTNRSQRHRDARAHGPITITQRELEEYYLAHAKFKRLKRELQAERESLLNRVVSGARVAPGAFKLEAKVINHQAATWSELERLLDNTLVGYLREEIVVRTYDRLTVSRRK